MQFSHCQFIIAYNRNSLMSNTFVNVGFCMDSAFHTSADSSFDYNLYYTYDSIQLGQITQKKNTFAIKFVTSRSFQPSKVHTACTIV